MKSGFKDPTAPKGNTKKMKSTWNFDQPEYDERSGCFVNAGSHYGVGHRQPVGKEGNPKAPKVAHTSNSKKGLGDFYGTGLKAKMGKMVEGVGTMEVTPKKMKTPPKSLA